MQNDQLLPVIGGLFGDLVNLTDAAFDLAENVAGQPAAEAALCRLLDAAGDMRAHLRTIIAEREPANAEAILAAALAEGLSPPRREGQA